MFKPKKPTKLKNRLRKKTVEALEDLNQKIEEAKLRQDLLLQESRLLQNEILCLEAENCFVRVLRKQSKQCEKKHWELWNRYFQEREEISRKKQELTLRFAQQSAELQTQVWQGRSHQVQLRRQFQSMEHISSLKNNQKMKIQMLEKEIENMEVEMARQDRQAHLGFLQQRKHLVRQIEELKSLQAGGQGTTEVRRKARVLESTARKVNSEFCLGVCRENQELQEDLLKLIQEYHQLECIKRKLEMWKQWLKEERWYREALVRGRRQLKAKRERSHACDL